MKKFELAEETKSIIHIDKKAHSEDDDNIMAVECYRVRALHNFNNVQTGDLGGWVEKEENLSQSGDCWIYKNGYVIENAKVLEDATIGNDDCGCKTVICDSSIVKGESNIHNLSVIKGNSVVYGGDVFGCNVNNSIINGDCQELIFDNEILSKIDGLEDIQIPKELNVNLGSIMKAINKLSEHDRNELFRKLTEML